MTQFVCKSFVAKNKENFKVLLYVWDVHSYEHNLQVHIVSQSAQRTIDSRK